MVAKTVAALGRTQQRVAAESVTDVTEQARRFMSTVSFQTTAQMEIGDVMACFLILHQSCAYTNAAFQVILLTQFLHFINHSLDDRHPAPRFNLTRVDSESDMVPDSQVFDYMFRPPELSNVSMIEFLLCYEKKDSPLLASKRRRSGTILSTNTSNTDSDSDDSSSSSPAAAPAAASSSSSSSSSTASSSSSLPAADQKLRFRHQHSQHATTYLQKRKDTVLADFIGPRMPDADDDASQED